MMCSKNIDGPRTHMSIVARLSHLFVLCSQKIKQLLDHLDNRCTMHGFQNIALEWVRGNRNDTHYYSAVMLRGL
jgi:hypothetical protein